MAQEHSNMEISRLYLDVATLCFNRAAAEEDVNGAEVFRRMGRRYIDEAKLYDTALQLASARQFALP